MLELVLLPNAYLELLLVYFYLPSVLCETRYNRGLVHLTHYWLQLVQSRNMYNLISIDACFWHRIGRPVFVQGKILKGQTFLMVVRLSNLTLLLIRYSYYFKIYTLRSWVFLSWCRWFRKLRFPNIILRLSFVLFGLWRIELCIIPAVYAWLRLFNYLMYNMLPLVYDVDEGNIERDSLVSAMSLFSWIKLLRFFYLLVYSFLPIQTLLFNFLQNYSLNRFLFTN